MSAESERMSAQLSKMSAESERMSAQLLKMSAETQRMSAQFAADAIISPGDAKQL